MLIPLFALWANLHGGYIWGILLLIAVLVGELFNHFLGNQAKNDNFFTPAALKKLAIFSGLALFAVLLNPSGLELWRLPFHTVDVSLSIQEWRSPDFHQISFHPLLWMLFLFILALGASGKRIDYNDLFKVLGFAYLTFVSQRNIAPFSIILLPVLSRHLSFAWDVWRMSPFGKFLGRWRINFSSRQLPVYLTRSINSLLVLLVGLIAITNLYLQTRPYKIEEAYPFDAVQWIKDTQPDGHLFNSYNWGGYLIWELRDYPVFIDGRADLYGDEIIYQWRQILAGGEKAQELLNKWGINLILVESNWRQADVLPQYGWKLLYQDKLSVIYGR